MSRHMLYFYFDPDISATISTTRVYFTEMLDAKTFDSVIRPALEARTLASTKITAIEGYPHSVSVYCLKDRVIIRKSNIETLREEVQELLDIVLTNALGWNGSVIGTMHTFSEVNDTSSELGVNWSRNQRPL